MRNAPCNIFESGKHTPFLILFLVSALAHAPAAKALGILQYTQPAKLTASDSTYNYRFGSYVSISADTMIVGASRSSHNTVAAYIFQRHPKKHDKWKMVEELSIDNGGPWFARYAVSISGDTAVVGGQIGSVYVFQRHRGRSPRWSMVKRLGPPYLSWGSGFGSTLEVSGDTIVVGALWGDGIHTNTGLAHVYRRDEGGPGNWGEVRELAAFDGFPGDKFGRAVSLNGDTIIVGASDDHADNYDSGSAYIFQKDRDGPDKWGLVKKLVVSPPGTDRLFGSSVSLHGDTAVVGSASLMGNVYVFERDRGGPDNWGQVRRLQPSTRRMFSAFGMSVSVRGDTIVAGAPLNHIPEASDGLPGTVYVFKRDQGGPENWGQAKRLFAYDHEDDDRFGSSVSAGDDGIVVGAPLDSDEEWRSGSVYYFSEYTHYDFNDDSRTDILWRHNGDGRNAVWFMDGGTVIGADMIRRQPDIHSYIAGSFDFNGDAMPDILWARDGGAHGGDRGRPFLSVMYMNGTNVIGQGMLRGPPPPFLEASTVNDFYADGMPDIALLNNEARAGSLVFLEGRDIIGDTGFPLPYDADWRVACFADFDGDSRQDIILRNYVTGSNHAVYMSGTIIGNLGPIPSVMDMAWRLEGCGDFSGDGRPDLIWRNYETGQNYLWIMDGLSYSGGVALPTVSDPGWHIEN